MGGLTQAFSFDKCLTLKPDLDNDLDTWPESDVNHSWLCLQYNGYYTELIIMPKCMITAFDKCLTLKMIMTFDTDLNTEVDTWPESKVNYSLYIMAKILN